MIVPNDQRFWNDLIANKSKVGMFMYEQDWLDTEFDRSKTLGESATMARTWMLQARPAPASWAVFTIPPKLDEIFCVLNRQRGLTLARPTAAPTATSPLAPVCLLTLHSLLQMNAGCVNSNVTIQMCMSHVRHIMQSLEMPAVTNARASGDYHPGSGQWHLGTSSILAHAVGIAPSKDNYWSTAIQNGTRYGKQTSEPRGRLQAAVLSFSNGPVAPSDMVGGSNRTIILKACDSGGTLLSPDKPATTMDCVFRRAAFGASAGDGPVLRLFPLRVFISHAQGSSGVVATMPFVWRGRTKSPTTRAGPSLELACGWNNAGLPASCGPRARRWTRTCTATCLRLA